MALHSPQVMLVLAGSFHSSSVICYQIRPTATGECNKLPDRKKSPVVLQNPKPTSEDHWYKASLCNWQRHCNKQGSSPSNLSQPTTSTHTLFHAWLPLHQPACEATERIKTPHAPRWKFLGPANQRSFQIFKFRVRLHCSR